VWLVQSHTLIGYYSGGHAEIVEELHMVQERTLPETDQECSSSGATPGILKIFLAFAFVVALLSLAFSHLGIPSTR